MEKIFRVAGIIFFIGLAAISCSKKSESAVTVPQEKAQEAVQETVQEVMGKSDFEIVNGVITGYNGTETSVVIPKEIQGQTVIMIGSEAFYQKNLTGIIIPDSVDYIASYAFYGNQLDNVHIGNSVTVIESSAFAKNRLTSIIIPDSLREIRGDAFADNPLEQITIGAYVELMSGRDIEYDRYFYAFNEDFDNVYKDGGEKAGTYILNNGIWSLQDDNQSAAETTAFTIADTFLTVSNVLGNLGDHHFYADNQTSERIVFTAKVDLQNFAYIEIELAEEGFGFTEGKTLFSLDDFTPAKPLVISANIGEGIPSRGILFFGEGSVRHYYLRENGMDGSIELVPFAPQ